MQNATESYSWISQMLPSISIKALFQRRRAAILRDIEQTKIQIAALDIRLNAGRRGHLPVARLREQKTCLVHHLLRLEKML